MKYNTLRENTTQDGFTLLEVLVAMGLFIVILVIASNAFNRIVAQSSTYAKMEESNIEGVIGLEIMRHDIEAMGFGLPWGFSKADTTTTPPSTIIDSTISYSEATDTLGALLNDSATTTMVPRAFVSYATKGAFSSDYFALKGTTQGNSKSAQRWTYIPFHNYSGTSGLESRPVITANSPQSDKVIFINSNVNDAVNKDHRLLVSPTSNTSFYQDFALSGMSDNFLPTDDQQTYMVYSLYSGSPSSPRMPFNRSDFFIKVPTGSTSADGSLPPFCEQTSTGVLYKATVNHSDGGYTYLPLLDCVADMQVVLGWDTSDGGLSGSITTYTTLPQQSDGNVANIVTTDPAGITNVMASIKGWLADAKGLREHLKIVKVYVLAQDGKRDASYKYPSTTIRVGDVQENNGLSVKSYTLTTAQMNYRWKLYRIIVRPKNLVSNQR